MKHFLAAALTSGVLFAGVAQLTPVARADDSAQTPTDGSGLKVGDTMRDSILTTRELESVSLKQLAQEKGPLVVTFYRGGWCPFCNKALAGWQSKMEELEGAGGTFVAITPEKPDLMIETAKKNKLNYMVLSDANNEAAKALNVLFTVDEATRKKYEGYGIHLEASNASGEWKLPHPATFIIDKQGVVKYAHVDPDYAKGRAEPGEVIDALKSLK